jgi:CubicO group peptidase (beta-lactamase class C family)
MTTPHMKEIAQLAAETQLSGVIHVSRGDTVLLAEAFGFADRAHEIPNEVDTQFAIASGTKGFTALGVMALVEDGLLTLGTSVREILGDVLELIDPRVTVEQLLAHTSGIGDYLDEETVDDSNDYVLTAPVHELATAPDYVKILKGYPMKFEPGSRFEYCNGGYVVLALVIEAVSKSTFHEWLDERIFRPAGMTSTSFLRSDQLPGTAAIGYLPADEGWRTNHLHLPVRGVGDGGAYSTAGDMQRFWTALFAGQILPASVVNEMTRVWNTHEPENAHYGLGFWIREDRDTVTLVGCDPGVSFQSAYDRPSDLLYTVISNTSTGAWPIVKKLGEKLPQIVA